MEPGLPELFADVSHIERKWLDIPYAGVSPAQALDIYLPAEGDGPFPVIFVIHGGGFEMGDKRHFMVAPFLTGLDRGYAVVAANYRLSGEAHFPAAVRDLKAAVRWLRANAAAYRLDPGRIAACGDSAGGNLAAMLATSEGAVLFDDATLGNVEQSSAVQAAVDWYGPMDFYSMPEQLEANGLPVGPPPGPPVGMPDIPFPGSGPSPEVKYLGAELEAVPHLVRAADPETYLHPGIPPILIQHGDADGLVPVQQSIEFAQLIERRVGPRRCELDILEGAGHGTPEFGSPDNMERVFRFLDRHLRP